jgi:four helix bundle protein
MRNAYNERIPHIALRITYLALRKGASMNKQIRMFTDLEAWQLGHEFVIDVYKKTNDFPKYEIYGVVNQLRRSAASITSNIAEGFSRYSYKEKVRFYYIARGSISESQNHIIISRDVGYLPFETADALLSKADRIRQIINGLIRATETQL